MAQYMYMFSRTTCKSTRQQTQCNPINFGIIAAISQNNIIGINGTLPWRIPEDFRYFQDITRDKVVILGRRTFGENLWMHARHSIVISSSMNADDDEIDLARTTIARTLNDGLDIARTICVGSDWKHVADALHVDNDDEHEHEQDSKAIHAWVIGGENIFLEALQHPAVNELRLTKVGFDVDTRYVHDVHVRRFPPVSVWGNDFEQVGMWDGQDSCDARQYSFHVYRRLS